MAPDRSGLQRRGNSARRRPARLPDQACGSDTELRREVESLLRSADEGSDVVLERVHSAFAAYVGPSGPAASESGSAEAVNLTAAAKGQRIGAYVLIREIGHGGMGSVFLAERADDQFCKQVAVKLTRGVPSADLLRRFRGERQILATLVGGGVGDAVPDTLHQLQALVTASRVRPVIQGGASP